MLFSTASAQEKNPALDSLKSSFDNFEYEAATELAEELLYNKDLFSESEVIEIHRMKAVSHFILGEDKQSEREFRNILELNSSYRLNPSVTSPKIISFFETIRGVFIKERDIENTPARVDTVYIEKAIGIDDFPGKNRDIMYRSMILPGWGHLYKGEETKGIILTSLSALSIGSFIFYAFDTESKKEKYIHEKNREKVVSSYDDYNLSYNLRNISIISFGVIWLLSQVDLLFISPLEPAALKLTPEISGTSFYFNFQYTF